MSRDVVHVLMALSFFYGGGLWEQSSYWKLIVGIPRIGVWRSHLLLSFFERKICWGKKQWVQISSRLTPYVYTLYTYVNTYLPRLSPSGFVRPPRISSRPLCSHQLEAPRPYRSVCVCVRVHTHTPTYTPTRAKCTIMVGQQHCGQAIGTQPWRRRASREKVFFTQTIFSLFDFMKIVNLHQQ